MGEGVGPGLVGDASIRAKKSPVRQKRIGKKNRDTHFCYRPGERMSGCLRLDRGVAASRLRRCFVFGSFVAVGR